MTLILTILLVIQLSGLLGLLFLVFTRKKKQSLVRWCVVLALLCLLTGILRFIVFKEDQATAPGDFLTSEQPAGTFSPAFYQSLEKVFVSYLSLVNVFVKDNTSQIERGGRELKTVLDSLNIEELVADTLLYDVVYLSLENTRAETASILADPDLAEKRASLNILSQEFFNMLKTLGIQKPVYRLLVCPDAFGKERSGYWIGEENSLNPYGIPDCRKTDQFLGKGPGMQTNVK